MQRIIRQKNKNFHLSISIGNYFNHFLKPVISKYSIMSIMDTETSGFSFKWNKYFDNMKLMLQSMLLSSDFTDVTLVSDDQKQI